MSGRADGRGGAAGRPGVRRGPAVRQQRVVRRVRGDRAESRVPGRQDRHEPGDAAGPAHRAAGAPAGRSRRRHHAHGSAGGPRQQQPVPHGRPVRARAPRAAGLGDAGRPRGEGGGSDQRGRAAAEPGARRTDGADGAGGGHRGGPGRDRGGRRRRGDGPAGCRSTAVSPRAPSASAFRANARAPPPPHRAWTGAACANWPRRWAARRPRPTCTGPATGRGTWRTTGGRHPRAARPAPEHVSCRRRPTPASATGGVAPADASTAKPAGRAPTTSSSRTGGAARHALPPSAGRRRRAPRPEHEARQAPPHRTGSPSSGGTGHRTRRPAGRPPCLPPCARPTARGRPAGHRTAARMSARALTAPAAAVPPPRSPR